MNKFSKNRIEYSLLLFPANERASPAVVFLRLFLFVPQGQKRRGRKEDERAKQAGRDEHDVVAAASSTRYFSQRLLI